MTQPEGRPPRKKVRGRAVLCWAAVAVVVGELLISWAVDYPLRGYRFKQQAELISRAAIGALDGRSPVLCLGSSRLGCALLSDKLNPAWEASDPGHAPPFLNLGMATSSGPCMRELYHTLDRNGLPRPLLAVVEVCPESIGMRHAFFHFDCCRYLTAAEYLALLPLHLDDTKLTVTLAMRLNPAYGFRDAVTAFMRDAVVPAAPAAAEATPSGKQALPDHFRDVFPPLDSPLRPEAQASGIRKLKKWLRDYQPGGPNLRELDRLVADLRGHGVPVLLVVPPFNREHRSHYLGHVDQAFRTQIDRLCDRHGCSVVDCRDWVDDSLFWDGHHLAPVGADRFSRLFISRVLGPFAREGRLAGR